MGPRSAFGKTRGLARPPPSTSVLRYLYVLCNEYGKIVADVWDGINVRLTFRRNFSTNLFQLGLELKAITSTLTLSHEDDALPWQYENKGVYSTSSLYAIINFGGVSPSGLAIACPPKIHICVWLLAPEEKEYEQTY